MKKITFIGIMLSIVFLAGVSYAGVGPVNVLFADQDMPVGYCGVYSTTPNPDPMQVCVDCNLVQFDSLIDGAWCGKEVKWDTGVETTAGMVTTVVQTKKYDPIPGKFPYKGPFINVNENGLENFNECPMSFNGCAPAAEACASGASGPIAVAIQGNIYKYYDDEIIKETAWAAECLQSGPDGIFGCQEWGTDFAGKNWATYVHIPCNTGLPGNCSSGVLSCDDGAAFCDGIQEPHDEICDDFMDNDCDGFTNCSDTDCANDPACQEICDDGIDNDQDGFTDCSDSDCPACLPETDCSDGVDNDSDGYSDCDDSDCAADPACINANSCVGWCGESAPGGCYCDESCSVIGDCCADVCNACGELTFCSPGTETDCSDGVDNDGDGFTDCSDSDCPACLPETDCSDDVDNDYDGYNDCADSDCAESPDCSCVGWCGTDAPGGCYCDEECLGFGDCCADVCNACGELTFCG